MKTIIMIMAIMFAIDCDAAMHEVKGSIPNEVIKSFNQQYPQQYARKWQAKNDTCIAEFTMSKRKHWAYYLNDGNWIKTETKLPWTWDLPKTVKSSWGHSAFGSWQIASIKQVQTAGNNIFTVRVFKDCGPDGSVPGDCEKMYRLYFYPDGTLFKTKHIE